MVTVKYNWGKLSLGKSDEILFLERNNFPRLKFSPTKFSPVFKQFIGIICNSFRIGSGLVVWCSMQHIALCTLTWKMPVFQQVILGLDKMILFCTVCTKSLKWIHINNFWLKNCKKKCNWCQKRKTMERRFPS